MSLSKNKRPEPITNRDMLLTFGKYRGESIADVMEYDCQYIVWLHHNSLFFELGADLLDEAENGGKEQEPLWKLARDAGATEADIY